MNKTSIEWTKRLGPDDGFTWNPIRASLRHNSMERERLGPRRGTFCTRISPGCQHCYASTINKRFGTGLDYTVPNLEHHEFWIDPKILSAPLRRLKPSTIFVGDMFDLFHESITDGMIMRVITTAARADWHTFQFLTKRAERMVDWFKKWADVEEDDYEPKLAVGPDAVRAAHRSGRAHLFASMLESMGQPPPGYAFPTYDWMEGMSRWPLTFGSHMWFGVSVENQEYADRRVPLVLEIPATVRFLSVEPQLEHIYLRTWKCACGWRGPESTVRGPKLVCPKCGLSGGLLYESWLNRLKWVICGGESGPGARPFDVAWAESILRQCRQAGCPFFMKQIGSRPMGVRIAGKGGDPKDWPAEIRVREWPDNDDLARVRACS